VERSNCCVGETIPLPLWGKFSGIVVFLALEMTCHNDQHGFTFRKILVPTYHPERLFYATIKCDTLVRQEKSINAAAARTGVVHIPKYYESRLWPNLSSPSKVRHMETVLGRENALAISAALKASKNIPNTECQNDFVYENEEIPLSDATIANGQERAWQKTFTETPNSNQRLIDLLPAAIETATCSDQDWHYPSMFPLPVRDWWEGQ
jgi:hypothetical protein